MRVSLEAAFREGHRPLAEVAGFENRLPSVLLREVVAALFGAITASLIWQASAYQDGNVELLREAASEGWAATRPLAKPAAG
jgi:hypothetical protein